MRVADTRPKKDRLTRQGNRITPLKGYPKPILKEIIREVFREDPEMAVKIAECESRLDSSAHNKDDPHNGSWGIFQINGAHNYSPEVLLNPIKNINIAHELYLKEGWEPWACYSMVK